jgi:superfamily II DNA helicase RecQ
MVYEFPAKHQHDVGVYLVVEPLRSLIRDQLGRMNDASVIALAFHGDNEADWQSNWDKIFAEDSTVRLLFTSPETAVKAAFIENLRKLSVFRGVAIDEAHTIVTWGDTKFRPKLLRLSVLRETFPNVPITALTASATPYVQRRICTVLGINPKFVRSSLYRRNIHLEAIRKPGTAKAALQLLLATLREHLKDGDSAVIYVSTQADAMSLAAALRQNGFRKTHAYHAGLPDGNKARVQDDFVGREGAVYLDVDIVVATCAFGMGIGEPRAVIYSLTSTTPSL